MGFQASLGITGGGGRDGADAPFFPSFSPNGGHRPIHGDIAHFPQLLVRGYRRGCRLVGDQCGLIGLENLLPHRFGDLLTKRRTHLDQQQPLDPFRRFPQWVLPSPQRGQFL